MVPALHPLPGLPLPAAISTRTRAGRGLGRRARGEQQGGEARAPPRNLRPREEGEDEEDEADELDPNVLDSVYLVGRRLGRMVKRVMVVGELLTGRGD